MAAKKHTRFDLQKMKEADQTIVWITAYDYWTANFAEQAGMDMILVGDSLGCVFTVIPEPFLSPWISVSVIAMLSGTLPQTPSLSAICHFCLTRSVWKKRFAMPGDSTKRPA